MMMRGEDHDRNRSGGNWRVWLVGDEDDARKMGMKKCEDFDRCQFQVILKGIVEVGGVGDSEEHIKCR